MIRCCVHKTHGSQNAALNIVEYDPEATWLDRLQAANPTRPLCDLDGATEELHCP